MRRFALVVPLALFAGCVVRTVPYGYSPYAPYSPPPAAVAAPRAEVYYYGNHFIPESVGGGWCYIDGPHVHDYYPDRTDLYVFDQGYYWYRGPFEFTFFGGHPLPGGGWCYISGPHRHDYFPPSGADWRWSRGAYVYEGRYRPNAPPPPSYWPQAGARVDYGVNRPAVRPAPVREGAGFRSDSRPPPGGVFEPRPGREERPPGQFRPEDDRRGPPGQLRPEDDRRGPPGFTPPGHEDRGGAGRPFGPPPGQGGAPPGQSPGFTPPGHEDRGAPGRPSGPPSGQGVAPPGHGGTPPGQQGRPDEGKRGKRGEEKENGRGR